MQVCPKCFAKNDAEALHCTECGTSFLPDADADSEIYLELSQANLHRTRGEHQAAIDVCLGILRRFPSNFSAHILIGDLHAETGDFDQAIQWFEMAKDLHPNDNSVEEKIEEIRRKEIEAERLLTGEGQSPAINHSNLKAYVAAVVALFLVVTIIAFMSGRLTERASYTQVEVVDEPIIIDSSDLLAANNGTGDGGATPSVEDLDETEPAPQDENTENSPPQEIEVIDVLRDPRGPSIIARVKLPQGVNEYAFAQQAAKHLLEMHANVTFVNLRLESDGTVMFVADAYRSDFSEDEEGGGVLRNVWPPPGAVSN